MNQENKGKSSLPNKSKKNRLYISIFWKCCHVFSRIYKNKAGSHYQGNCPRCRAFLSVPVGENGTSQRTFIAE